MKKAWKYIVAVLIVIVGVFMLGMISGDNETATPAGIAESFSTTTLEIVTLNHCKK